MWKVQGTGPAILIADDENVVLDFTGLVLKRAGFRVLTAASAAGALTLCKQGAEPIDAAILDIVMPEMNGFDLRDNLRQYYPVLPVLFMSGYPANEVNHRFGTTAHEQ